MINFLLGLVAVVLDRGKTLMILLCEAPAAVATPWDSVMETYLYVDLQGVLNPVVLAYFVRA